MKTRPLGPGSGSGLPVRQPTMRCSSELAATLSVPSVANKPDSKLGGGEHSLRLSLRALRLKFDCGARPS